MPDDAADLWDDPIFRAGYRAGYQEAAAAAHRRTVEAELARIERDRGRLGRYGQHPDESYVDEYYGKNDL